MRSRAVNKFTKNIEIPVETYLSSFAPAKMKSLIARWFNKQASFDEFSVNTKTFHA